MLVLVLVFVNISISTIIITMLTVLILTFTNTKTNTIIIVMIIMIIIIVIVIITRITNDVPYLTFGHLQVYGVWGAVQPAVQSSSSAGACQDLWGYFCHLAAYAGTVLVCKDVLHDQAPQQADMGVPGRNQRVGLSPHTSHYAGYAAAILFQPMYRLGHPENDYIFITCSTLYWIVVSKKDFICS